MIYKSVSSDNIIAKVNRDFKTDHSGWYKDAIEWIGEGLAIIGCHSGYAEKDYEVEICDYKAKLPCSLEIIEAVSYNGIRLPINAAQDDRCFANYGYKINPNYIHTNFEKGCIIIYGLAIPVDCNGFPLIPDDVFYREALAWLIMTKLLLRGYKHPVIDYQMAYSQWEKLYPRAQNSGNFPDIDHQLNFINRWNNLILDVNAASNFYNNRIPDSTRPFTETGNIEEGGVIIKKHYGI